MEAQTKNADFNGGRVCGADGLNSVGRSDSFEKNHHFLRQPEHARVYDKGIG